MPQPRNFRTTGVTLAAWLLAAVVTAAAPASAVAQQAAFGGRVISGRDSTPIRNAEIRLMFVDSTRTTPSRRGAGSPDVFVDSARTRVATSDSTGAFLIRALAPGHYLVRMRRIGYSQVDAVLSVDSIPVRAVFPMQETSHVLATVKITERAYDRAAKSLERSGFDSRANMGMRATFVRRKDFVDTRANTARDVLAKYFIRDADVLLDRMPVSLADVENYPADAILGIEIYDHGRPVEFAHVARPAGADETHLGTNPAANPMRPLVVIWTFVP